MEWKVEQRKFRSLQIMLDKFVSITSSLLELSVFFAAGAFLVVGMLFLR
jgi:hypothetical protein